MKINLCRLVTPLGFAAFCDPGAARRLEVPSALRRFPQTQVSLREFARALLAPKCTALVRQLGRGRTGIARIDRVGRRPCRGITGEGRDLREP